MIKYHGLWISAEKEEAWVAGILQKGYRLVKVNPTWGRYEFLPKGQGEPSQTVRIDFRVFSKAEDYTDYLALFEDSGWRHLGGNRYMGLQYFEKLEAAGDEDIFSTAGSKAAVYRRMASYWLGASAAQMPGVICMQLVGAMDMSRWLH